MEVILAMRHSYRLFHDPFGRRILAPRWDHQKKSVRTNTHSQYITYNTTILHGVIKLTLNLIKFETKDCRNIMVVTCFCGEYAIDPIALRPDLPAECTRVVSGCTHRSLSRLDNAIGHPVVPFSSRKKNPAISFRCVSSNESTIHFVTAWKSTIVL